MREREQQKAPTDPWQLYRIEARLIILDRQIGYLIKHLNRIDRNDALARKLDAATESLAKVVSDNQLPK